MSQAALKIKQIVDEFMAEDEKFENGNNSAGTRARKALMELKKAADQRRREIQEKKNSDK